MSVGKQGFRADIQGMRAIAVGLVLLYHVWPAFVPGGYVGVDVFFVISGFLITSLLLREVERTGTIGLLDFYVRRARRLLPAALSVLVVSFLAFSLLLPELIWKPLRIEFAAAAVYLENWVLASKSVDYLAADGVASPVQHYWSLSIEEQFYIAWPFLILLAVRWRKAGSIRRTLSVAFGLVVAVSLGCALQAGYAGDPSAYFTTHTRVWQLAAGGMIALWPGLRLGAAELLLGLLLILFAALSFSGDTVYPGAAALVPTLGAALAIMGGRAFPESFTTRWLGSRPATWLGDISYSLYLWHWPVIMLTRHLGGEDAVGPMAGIAVVLVSLLLAELSRRFIEDRFRHAATGRRPLVLGRYALASLAFATAAVLVGGPTAPQGPAGLASEATHPGALAWYGEGRQPVPDVPFVPALAAVPRDVAAAYGQGCIQNGGGSEVKVCSYGNRTAGTRVAVVGDSHAVHWLPAFEALAETHDLYIEGLTKTSCSPSGLEVSAMTSERPYISCVRWTDNVVDYVRKGDFDYVILSQSPKHRLYELRDRPPERSARALAKGLFDTWHPVARDGTPIRIIRPTPWQPTVVPNCASTAAAPFRECTDDADAALGEDAMVRFASMSGFPLLDFTDLLCRDGACPAVVGNVFVYRDAHHLTGTFAQTLAQPLYDRLGLDRARVSVAAPSFEFSPDPFNAAADRPRFLSEGCVRSSKVDSVKTCEFGPEDGTHVVVVGDATGANYMPAFELLAERLGLRVVTYFKDSCLFGAEDIHHRVLKATYSGCSRWSREVKAILEEKPPAAIFITQSPMYRRRAGELPGDAGQALGRGVAAYTDGLHARGVKILGITGAPWFEVDVPSCVRDHGVEDCGRPVDQVVPLGPVDHLVRAGRARGISVSDVFCPEGWCAPVQDKVLVYRDSNQPTATFMDLVGEKLSRSIEQALNSDDSVSREEHG